MSEINCVNQSAIQELTTNTTAPSLNEARVQEITNEILSQKKQIACSFIQIGKLLDEAKGPLKKEGRWLKWLGQVGIPERMAQRYIQLAKAFPDPTSVSGLGMTKALTLLALPEAQRERFISETHKIDGTPKSLSEMSVREVRRAIHEQTMPIGEATHLSKADTLQEANGEPKPSLPKSTFRPVLSEPRTTVIPNSQQNVESSTKPSDLGTLVPDLQSAQTHLDGILRVLKSQTVDDAAQDEIANELHSLHEKVQKCLSLVSKHTD